MDGFLDRIDGLQRRWRFTSFIWAVQKKYSEDRGGYLSALVTYYGFLSIFPLLLAAFTIIAFVLAGDRSALHSLEQHISSYPIINQAASGLDRGTMHGSTLALIVGILGLIWGSQGLAQAAQFTMDEAWNVPNRTRPGFIPRTIRSFGWYAAFGVGAVASTFVSSLGQALHWAGGPLLSTALSFVVAVALFLMSFWILTPRGIAVRDMVPGAVTAGIAWAVLTGLGVGLTTHLAHANPLYGSFATVLGLLALIYLNARITIYCIEANVVRSRRLWPRSFTNRNLTGADLQQLENLAGKEERIPPERVQVDVQA